MNNIDITKFKLKIFADGADIDSMLSMKQNKIIKGFTTNPTLMKKAGITNYEKFAKAVLDFIPDLPISFEVFADEKHEIERQAIKISSWGKNVNVKIPITNTNGERLLPTIERLSQQGIQLNITAILTEKQVEETSKVLNQEIYNIISVFAGRIADTGVDPKLIMSNCKSLISARLSKTDLLWASPRQALNIIEAEQVGCDIITITQDLLNKASNFGKNLEKLSLETVNMFYKDALQAGYKL